MVRLDQNLQRENRHQRHVQSEKMTNLHRRVSRDTESLICGYGYNVSMYNSALQRLENEIGNPTKIVPSFLRLDDWATSAAGPLRHNRSYKSFVNFLQTMVDTFTTLGSHHDLYSTTNFQTVLRKLSTPCRLKLNRCNFKNDSPRSLT